MNSKHANRTLNVAAFALAAGLALASARAQAPSTTAFTYQGQVRQSGTPINGLVDVKFRLYDSATGGAQVGPELTQTGVSLSNGLFSTQLDFGSVFQGNDSARWLEISVKNPASPAYTVLSPRTAITAAPLSLVAKSVALPYADSLNSASPLVSLTNPGTGSVIRATGNTTGATGVLHGDGGNAGRGVYGSSVSSDGVVGDSATGRAVFGYSASSGYALFGSSQAGYGGFGENRNTGNRGYIAGAFDGLAGVSNVNTGSGVTGLSTHAGGIGGYFNNSAGGIALKADGLAQVKVLQILGGSDLAEPFDVALDDSGAKVKPGMVVVIDEANPGKLRLADQPYDGRVAGVISGANGLAPGMIMRAERQQHADGEFPLAMTGRVWVYVDASFGAIKPGDRLTTSATPGHAMRVDDTARSVGTVMGKAMTTLQDGKGLVLVLVNLQ